MFFQCITSFLAMYVDARGSVAKPVATNAHIKGKIASLRANLGPLTGSANGIKCNVVKRLRYTGAWHRNCDRR
jgi:hypothetical protein